MAYGLRQTSPENIHTAMSNFGFYPPLPTLVFLDGFIYLFGPMLGLFAVILPISIYNFVETMNNVEAMSSCGDDYNVQEAQLADGIGTIIGSLFGGVFPTTVYIASVGSKWMGAGRGYSILNGFMFLITSTFGIVAVLAGVIPVPVIAPILVFVGISMVSQAFGSVERKYFPAVTLAMIPYFANYVMTRFNTAAVGAVTPVGETIVVGQIVGNVSGGIVPLGQGAMFTALIWGAMMVYIIDEDYSRASIASLFGAGLSVIGLIHAPQLSISLSSPHALGYIMLAILFLAFKWMYSSAPS